MQGSTETAVPPRKGVARYFPFLPRGIRGRILQIVPGTRAYKRERWVSKFYTRYAIAERERLFLGISRFCHINRPTEGYYFEFGCHEGKSMRLAYKHFQHLFDFHYVAFDSFQGLPEISKIDEQQIWKKGKLKTTEDDFREIVSSDGMPPSKLTTVSGFFDQSLNEETRKKFSGKKAAIIYVDCDLYVSTIPVLEFCRHFLQRGTILVFDDWNCFHGDPDRGERRAFREFLAKYPDLVFEPFMGTNEAQSFVFLGDRVSLSSAE